MILNQGDPVGRPYKLKFLEMEKCARGYFTLADVMPICAEETAKLIADDLIVSRVDVSRSISSLETQSPFWAEIIFNTGSDIVRNLGKTGYIIIRR